MVAGTLTGTMMTDFMTVVEKILALLGLVGLVVAAIGKISYALFQHYGEKWLDARFEKQLVDYKHAQQRELEQLKLKIDTLFDRTVKLHQREFEVLPEAWARLNDAFWKTRAFISPVKTYPDLDAMSKDQLEEFLAASPLAKWQKTQLMQEQGKTAYYIKQMFWHRLVEVRDEIVKEAHIYIQKNGIFLPVDLKNKFTALSDLVWEALLEYQLNEQHGMVTIVRDKQNALNQKGEGLLKELEADVHKRLWSAQRLASSDQPEKRTEVAP